MNAGRFLSPSFNDLPSDGSTTPIRIKMPFGGNLTEMRVKQNIVGSGPGALIGYQVAINGVPGPMQVTMTPGQDNAISVTNVPFVDGDEISLEAIVAGADLTSAPGNIIAAIAFTSS
jgi:hypothetical protein